MSHSGYGQRCQPLCNDPSCYTCCECYRHVIGVPAPHSPSGSVPRTLPERSADPITNSRNSKLELLKLSGAVARAPAKDAPAARRRVKGAHRPKQAYCRVQNINIDKSIRRGQNQNLVRPYGKSAASNAVTWTSLSRHSGIATHRAAVHEGPQDTPPWPRTGHCPGTSSEE